MLSFFQAAGLIQLLSLRALEPGPKVGMLPTSPPAPQPGSQERFLEQGTGLGHRGMLHLARLSYCGLWKLLCLLHKYRED